jgi:hypothetical protein
MFGSRPEIAKPKFGSSHTCGRPYFVAKILRLVCDQSLAKKPWQLFGLLPQIFGKNSWQLFGLHPKVQQINKVH